MTGLTYNPLTRSFHLSTNTAVNYLAHFTRVANGMTLPLRAVLFDLDGTVLDTAPDMVGRVELAARRAGPSAAALRCGALPGEPRCGCASSSVGFPDASAEKSAALQRRFLEIYRTALSRRTRLFPGMDEVLDELAERRLKVGIVTNKAAWLTEPLLEELGLRARFDCVVSGDTCLTRKPHPLPLLHAAKLAGVTPGECIYVGDAERDVQAAHAAGMAALVANYGYLQVR